MWRDSDRTTESRLSSGLGTAGLSSRPWPLCAAPAPRGRASQRLHGPPGKAGQRGSGFTVGRSQTEAGRSGPLGPALGEEESCCGRGQRATASEAHVGCPSLNPTMPFSHVPEMTDIYKWNILVVAMGHGCRWWGRRGGVSLTRWGNRAKTPPHRPHVVPRGTRHPPRWIQKPEISTTAAHSSPCATL